MTSIQPRPRQCEPFFLSRPSRGASGSPLAETEPSRRCSSRRASRLFRPTSSTEASAPADRIFSSQANHLRRTSSRTRHTGHMGLLTSLCAVLSSIVRRPAEAWRCFSIFGHSAIPTERRSSPRLRRVPSMPSMSSFAGPQGSPVPEKPVLPSSSIIGQFGILGRWSAQAFGGFQPSRSRTRNSGFLVASRRAGELQRLSLKRSVPRASSRGSYDRYQPA